MAQFNLIGGSYSSQSLNADCQETKNWYPEVVESQQGKSAMVLYPTPGTSTFCTLPGGGPIRAELEINGRSFAISGPNFCEVKTDGSFQTIAQVRNDNSNASMVASPQQILIASAGSLYVYWLQTTVGGSNPQPAGTFVQIAPATFTLTNGMPGSCIQVEFLDGFFIVLLANSQSFYISALFDASTWLIPTIGGMPQPGATPQLIIVSVYSDNVQSILASQRRLWVLGRKRSTVYYDSGSANIFDVDPSGTMENGTIGPFASARLDNAVFWLDQDERGYGVARRGVGYTPTRISNHAIEFAWQGYSTISDCIVYPYQDQGHTFAVFNFPTAKKTWVYDVATNFWHERGYWNTLTGNFAAHKSQNHMLAFGKHLVGDPGSGNIYQMAIPSAAVGGGYNFVTDNGNVIRRVRRAPHVGLEYKRMFYSELNVDMETGLGPEPPLLDGAGKARAPMMTLRTSKTYGKSWGLQTEIPCGKAGEFRVRARRTKLGSSKTGMVFELSVTDPIPWRIITGYLEAQPGYQPTERLVKQYAKVG